jgi:hypothetical protein
MWRLLNARPRWLEGVRELAPFSQLTADEEQLLDQLVVRWERDEVVTVGDMMTGSERTSGSTIYSRLVALRDKGLIEFRIDASDRRVFMTTHSCLRVSITK